MCICVLRVHFREHGEFLSFKETETVSPVGEQFLSFCQMFLYDEKMCWLGIRGQIILPFLSLSLGNRRNWGSYRLFYTIKPNIGS